MRPFQPRAQIKTSDASGKKHQVCLIQERSRLKGSCSSSLGVISECTLIFFFFFLLQQLSLLNRAVHLFCSAVTTPQLHPSGGTDLTKLKKQWMLMHSQLAPLRKWDIIWRQANCFKRFHGEGEVCFGGVTKVLWLPSIWFGNKWRPPFFPVPAPEMIRSITEGQESTNMSLGDREITPGWQKASATSITCTVLPAIIRSLKAIFQPFQRWGPSVPLRFYPDDWPERHLLMLWFMAADFIALFPATPSFSHISHVVLYPLSLPMLSRFFFSSF